MSKSNALVDVSAQTALDTIWFTRCPVPTASGLAYKLGWLDEEFAKDNIRVQTLQDRDSAASGSTDVKRQFSHHHYDHDLPGLFREGGNLLAIAARAQGAPNRVIGLTWIDEGQSLIVRPDSGIKSTADLKGKRIAVPVLVDNPVKLETRGRSIWRAMTLHGIKGALTHAGLTFDDVKLVEVPESFAFDALNAGEADVVYVKGAAAFDKAKAAGLVVGVDLDSLPERRFRVNNGTPRPITVHEDLLESNFDLVVRFLYQSLRAAEWAKTHLDETLKVLQGETSGSAEAVAHTYRNGFHLSLHPDLDQERIELYRQQKDFLLLYGFLDRDFDFDQWIDPRPLEAAKKLLAETL
jgi:ABC-type nitrate/sulfonate/bicarbonate transport system substrate-binding protein